MNRESMKRLRLDQRLIHRRSWISGEDLERELEELPDAAHKAATGSDSATSAQPPAAAPETDETT